MLDETLLAEVQKRFQNRSFNTVNEIDRLFDIYVPDFELKGDKNFMVILNNPTYLFDGLPFAKIILAKTFSNLNYELQVVVLSEAIEQAWDLLSLTKLE